MKKKKLKLDLDKSYFKTPAFFNGGYYEATRPDAPLCALGKLHAADGEYGSGYALWEDLTGRPTKDVHQINDETTRTGETSIANHYKALKYALTELVKTGKVILKAADPKVQKELKKANLPFVEE